MMKKLIMAGIAILTVAISSCDEETISVGNSLTSAVDQFTIITDTFDVATNSLPIDSVVSQSTYTYIGRVKDPETGTYISCDYMTRFNILENDLNSVFPAKGNIINVDDDKEPVADSCFVKVMISAYQGDSLEAMKLQMREMAVPLREDTIYYTNYDVEASGKLRAVEDGGIRQNKVYSISDLTLSDSLRNVYRNKSYYEYVNIPLNKPYTDKNNKTYKNYGTYIMRTYYEHPEYFRNSNTFARNVCPGFYLKSTDGLGAMIEVAFTQLAVYYTHKRNDKNYSENKRFNSTDEILQTTHIVNDKKSIESLLKMKANENCTFLKTPAGIYTEVELPINEIKMGRNNNGEHLNDTIAAAKISFSRMNSKTDLSEIMLEEPTTLLLIERDSLYSFFEHRNMPNNVTSYLAAYNSTFKTYSFNNISGLINSMWNHRNMSPNWNKAVLIPVQTTTTMDLSSNSSSNIANEMNINSVRLVRGVVSKEDEPYKPSDVRISVIYNTNK